MDITSTSGPLTTTDADWLIVGYGETDSSDELGSPLSDLDEALGGAVSRLVDSGDLTGKLSESHLLADVPGLAAGRTPASYANASGVRSGPSRI